MYTPILTIAVLTAALGLSGGIAEVKAQPRSDVAQLTPSTSSTASTTDVYFINRAKNLARQAAITANGGLERYRPDPKMFGPAVQTTYARNSDGSITFTFTGGFPGAAPSIETVATVTPGGNVNLDYNGALRSGIGAGSLPPSRPPSFSTLSPPPGPYIIPVPPAITPPVWPSATPPASNSTRGLPSLTPSTPVPPVSLPPTSAIAPPQISPLTAISPSSVPSTITPPNRVATGWIDQDAFFAKARNLARQAAIKANGGLDRYRPEPAMFGPSSQSPAVKNSDGSITFTFKGGTPGAIAMTVESVVVVSP
ncbi:MAG TPA: hypothetical protein V6D19_08740, partial [Stenomitos sp.]